MSSHLEALGMMKRKLRERMASDNDGDECGTDESGTPIDTDGTDERSAGSKKYRMSKPAGTY